MLDEQYALAEGHLEAIGENQWLHHDLYLALCLISGGSFVKEGAKYLDEYLKQFLAPNEHGDGDAAAAAAAAAEAVSTADADPIALLALARLSLEKHSDANAHRSGIFLAARRLKSPRLEVREWGGGQVRGDHGPDPPSLDPQLKRIGSA